MDPFKLEAASPNIWSADQWKALILNGRSCMKAIYDKFTELV